MSDNQRRPGGEECTQAQNSVNQTHPAQSQNVFERTSRYDTRGDASPIVYILTTWYMGECVHASEGDRGVPKY